jgi:prephenate dehydratase
MTFKVMILKEMRVIIRDYPGSLLDILEVFKNNEINLTNVRTDLLNREGR